MAGRVRPGSVELVEPRRFPNRPSGSPAPCTGTFSACTATSSTACAAPPPGLVSVGVDSWAVDYGLLDSAGRLLGNPVHYRDSRTDGVMERVRAELGDDLLYRVSGLQFLPFNTIYQLAGGRPVPGRARCC